MTTTTRRTTAIAGYPTETSAAEIDKRYNPKHYQYTLDHTDRAYRANCPTIAGYAAKFGIASAASWIYMHLLALYGTSSCRDPNAAAAMPSFSESFAADTRVKGLRLSELMIFFARYNNGHYGSAYFDCRRIGNAFFKEFLPERHNELYMLELEESRQRNAESHFRAPNGESSLSLYLKIKKMAENGNNEARAYLERRLVLTDEEMEMFLKENKEE